MVHNSRTILNLWYYNRTTFMLCIDGNTDLRISGCRVAVTVAHTHDQDIH